MNRQLIYAISLLTICGVFAYWQLSGGNTPLGESNIKSSSPDVTVDNKKQAPRPLLSHTQKNLSTNLDSQIKNTEQDIVETQIEKKYFNRELNQVVSDKNQINLNSIMAMNSIEEFNIAMQELLEKASYDPTLLERNQQEKLLFTELEEALNGDIYIQEVACNNNFCMASIELINNFEWSEEIFERIPTKRYTAVSVEHQNEHAKYQTLLYSINQAVSSMAITED